MMLSVIVFLMVVLVAMFWTYQGFFSSLIMFFETLISLLIAANFYEPLNGLWREQLGDGSGLPLAFIALFLVSLFAMREVTDRLVKRNVTIPMYVDRAGGGLVGFFTGLLLIGSALIPLQMLPLSGDLFGYARVTDVEGRREFKTLGYLGPDSFAVWVVRSLSNDRFGGDNPFEVAKPDFLIDLYGQRCSTQSEDTHYVPDKCVEVAQYWYADKIDKVSQTLAGGQLKREFTVDDGLTPGNRYFVAHVKVKNSAVPKGQSGIRFRIPQFRLFGPPPGGEGVRVSPKCYLAVGMTDLYTNKNHSLPAVTEDQVRRLVRFNVDTNFMIAPTMTAPIASKETDDNGNETVAGYEFDVAFEVPEDFEPWYLEFKRGGRFDFSRSPDQKKTLFAKEPPDYAAMSLGGGASASGKAGKTGGSKPKGIINIAHAIDEHSGPSNLIPTVLDKRENTVAQVLQGGKLNDCHLIIEAPTEAIEEGSQVKEFFVPEDKRLLQVGAEKNFPESMIGRVFNFATNVISQIHVQDSEGKDYYAIGRYEAAVINGKWVFEIQYYPNAEAPDRQGTLKKADKVTAAVLKAAKPEERRYGFLFLTPPGVTITKIYLGARSGEGQTFADPIKMPD